MTIGYVAGQQARIDVVFLLAGQPSIEMEFVIDTGFEGALTMPPEAVAALGLPFDQELIANLADDSSIRVDVHRARSVAEKSPSKPKELLGCVVNL